MHPTREIRPIIELMFAQKHVIDNLVFAEIFFTYLSACSDLKILVFTCLFLPKNIPIKGRNNTVQSWTQK
jgi:hypothetical protein